MSIFDTVEKLVNSGVKASTIVQRLKKDKNFAKPMAKAIGYGFSPEMIIDKVMSLGARSLDTAATPERRAMQERSSMYTPEFAEKSKRFVKGAAQLGGAALAASQIPKAVGAAASGLEALMGDAREEQQATQEAPQAPSDLMSKAEKLPTKEELQASEASTKVEPRKVLRDFPQLDEYVRRQLKQGKSPAAIYMLLKGAKAFAGLVERYESSGESYFTRIRELVDELSSEKKQRKEPSGLMGKIEKTQRSASLDEAIRNAKRFT